MIILSHRGYRLRAPENTLQAFEDAIALGVDGIETDVRLTKDGLAILFHDRYTPDGRDVESVNKDELCALLGYSIPTLDEALETFGGIIWNIEIKTPSALAVSYSILKRYSSKRRLLITSFWHNLVEHFTQLANVECGILVAHHPFNEISLHNLLPQYTGIKIIVWYYGIVDPDLLRSIKESGVRNFVYGAATKDEHLHCLEIGVDGIICDHPEFVLDKASDGPRK